MTMTDTAPAEAPVTPDPGNGNSYAGYQMPEIPFASMFAAPEEVGPPKSILIHGDPGTHKTTIASEIIKVPTFDKVLIIDIDNGTEVLVNDPEVHRAIGRDFGMPGEKRINIVPIDKLSAQSFPMLKYFLGEPDGRGGWIKGAALQAPYDAVVLDTLDVAQESAVASLLANTVNDKGVLDSRAAWQEVNVWTTGLLWALQNDPNMIGVIVMHSKSDAEDTGQLKIKPKLQGGAKDNVAGIPSLVAHLQFKKNTTSKKTELVATVGENSVITAKNRYRLPDTIVDFNLPTLYAMIAEKQQAINSPIPTTIPASA